MNVYGHVLTRNKSLKESIEDGEVNGMNLSVICCPVDKSSLTKNETVYECSVCGRQYREEKGVLNLEYSTLPDVDGHVPYIWSDVFYFEHMLKQLVKPNAVIAEICSGPNIVVPLLLSRLNIPVTYFSIGINEAHLLQQKGGVRFPIHSVKGDATELPIASGTVDIYVGHHAINDIWLTKGTAGVERSYEEMHRVIKPDGYIIQSDCVLQHDARVGDPSTKIIGLSSLTRFLTEHRYHWVMENGGELDWVIASQQNSCEIAAPKEFTISGSL